MKRLNHEDIVNMLKQEETAFWEWIEHKEDREKIILNILYLKKAELLLKESLYFMNQVPNNKYDCEDGTKDHYKLCSKISKFLKELE